MSVMVKTPLLKPCSPLIRILYDSYMIPLQEVLTSASCFSSIHRSELERNNGTSLSSEAPTKRCINQPELTFLLVFICSHKRYLYGPYKAADSGWLSYLCPSQRILLQLPGSISFEQHPSLPTEGLSVLIQRCQLNGFGS